MAGFKDTVIFKNFEGLGDGWSELLVPPHVEKDPGRAIMGPCTPISSSFSVAFQSKHRCSHIFTLPLVLPPDSSSLEGVVATDSIDQDTVLDTAATQFKIASQASSWTSNCCNGGPMAVL
ncbi:unnamed protein product [Cyprideis torosa]|uniref:Uncharacterized protein n=1 Tax=Cyprideis torosa TaxID=163714 RepID=A0A7R8WLJ4_9CRUS|nr:unnamed protein product [Cyprideis torosa]CAG0904344.1 unnamed protein product [Cyprideis torosa]